MRIEFFDESELSTAMLCRGSRSRIRSNIKWNDRLNKTLLLYTQMRFQQSYRFQTVQRRLPPSRHPDCLFSTLTKTQCEIKTKNIPQSHIHYVSLSVACLKLNRGSQQNRSSDARGGGRFALFFASSSFAASVSRLLRLTDLLADIHDTHRHHQRSPYTPKKL